MPASSLPDLREALDLLESQQPREAVTVLETLTRQLPTYAAAHVLLARAYEIADDWDGALGAWQQAHFLLPSSARVRTGMRKAMRSVYELDTSHTSGDATPRPVAPSVTIPHPPEPEPTPEPTASTAARVPEPAPQPAGPRSVIAPPVALPVPFRLGERPSNTPPPQPEPPAAPLWTEVAPLAPEAAPEPARTPPPPVSASTATPLLSSPSAPLPAPSAPDLPDSWDAPALDRFDALDDLIDALDGARIMPRADLDELPTPELEQDIGEVVSPTLARIYLTQGQHLEAARIYDKLAAQQPARADEFRTRAAEARAQA